MGYLYRPMLKGNGRHVPEGEKRCPDPQHGKQDQCGTCGARFGKVWWMKYYVAGQPIRKSTETEDLEEARRRLKVYEGHAAEGKPLLPRSDKITFEELAEDYLTDYRVNGKKSIKRAYYNVEGLKLSFTGWRAMRIKTPDVRAHIARRQSDGAANGSINRELAGLKRMFNLALQDEKLPHAPYIPLLQEHNVRTGFFSEADYLALREVLPDYLKPVAGFAYTYGWRKGELLGLTWERVDFAAGTVRLDPGTTKNKEGRTVKLTPDLAEMLRGLWAATRALEAQTGRSIPWVFHHDGQQITDFRKLWIRCCMKAKLGGRIFHDFRRTAVRNMVRVGIPERVAMKISGHKTRSVFDRYNIVSEGDLEEAARKMAMGTFSGTLEQSHAPEVQQIA